MMEPILQRSSLRASHVGGALLHALLSKEGGEAMKRASKVRDHGKKPSRRTASEPTHCAWPSHSVRASIENSQLVHVAV